MFLCIKKPSHPCAFLSHIRPIILSSNTILVQFNKTGPKYFQLKIIVNVSTLGSGSSGISKSVAEHDEYSPVQ